MARQIDLNCDGGESFGIYRLGNDEEMMTQVTSYQHWMRFPRRGPARYEKDRRHG